MEAGEQRAWFPLVWAAQVLGRVRRVPAVCPAAAVLGGVGMEVTVCRL